MFKVQQNANDCVLVSPSHGNPGPCAEVPILFTLLIVSVMDREGG